MGQRETAIFRRVKRKANKNNQCVLRFRLALAELSGHVINERRSERGGRDQRRETDLCLHLINREDEPTAIPVTFLVGGK